MFLYLKSLVESDSPAFRERLGLAEGERAIPAGVIYVKTSVSDVKVKTPDDEAALALAKSSITREGMVMDDERVIEAMNLRYTPLYSARTPTSIPESKRNLLYSEEGWEELMETVEKSLLSVADRMRSGDVSPIPKEDSRGKTRCESCHYKPICRSAVIK